MVKAGWIGSGYTNKFLFTLWHKIISISLQHIYNTCTMYVPVHVKALVYVITGLPINEFKIHEWKPICVQYLEYNRNLYFLLKQIWFIAHSNPITFVHNQNGTSQQNISSENKKNRFDTLFIRELIGF